MAKPRLTSTDFHPEVLDAFDHYVHGRISRRDFLDRTARFAVGSVTAAGILESLSPDYVQAQNINFNDPRIDAQYLIYPSSGDWEGYLVKPAEVEAPFPAVLVIHENRGRNPYIEDVTRRLALAGFMAMSPDALTPMGGWPGNDDDGRELQAQMDRDDMFANWVAAFRYLRDHPESNGNVGAVGFCYGGGVVNQLAASLPGLGAGVAYYGRQVPPEQAAGIQAPMMFHNGELDTRILSGAEAFEQALDEAGVEYESYVYEGANHGFHNNSTPRYDEAAAELSWERTIEFFNTHLR